MFTYTLEGLVMVNAAQCLETYHGDPNQCKYLCATASQSDGQPCIQADTDASTPAFSPTGLTPGTASGDASAKPPATSSPHDTVTAATSTPPSTLGSGGTIDASIGIQNTWQTGYCANILLQNNTGSAITNWKVVLKLNDAVVTQQWNVKSQAGSGQMVFTPAASWNATIAAGSSNNSQGFCANLPSGGQMVTVISATGS